MRLGLGCPMSWPGRDAPGRGCEAQATQRLPGGPGARAATGGSAGGRRAGGDELIRLSQRALFSGGVWRGDDFILHLLPFRQDAETGLCDSRDVNEDIIPALVGLDKTVALSWIEPFHGSCGHISHYLH